MPEILPGNPTEAGPDTRNNEPPPTWHDLMMYAEEESSFVRRRNRPNTAEGRRRLLDAISRCKQNYEEAERTILAMGVTHGPR